MKINVHWPAGESCDVANTLINTSINKNPDLTEQCLIHNLTTELLTCNEHSWQHMVHCKSHSITSCCQSYETTEWPGCKDADKTSSLEIPDLSVPKYLGETDLSTSILLKPRWPGWVANLASSWALLPANPVTSFWKNQVEVEKIVYLSLEFLSHEHTWTKNPFKSHRYFLPYPTVSQAYQTDLSALKSHYIFFNQLYWLKSNHILFLYTFCLYRYTAKRIAWWADTDLSI